MVGDPGTDRVWGVAVDRDTCQGHNRCIALCPEAFEADELGYAVVRTPEVGPELEAKLRLAEANCPERAITVSSVRPSGRRR
jgi:ferredoxin